jgi:hypothetical protein
MTPAINLLKSPVNRPAFDELILTAPARVTAQR